MHKLLPLIITVLVFNIIAFFIYGIDKLKAKKNRWRIPEATLLLFALFGPLGAFLGMRIWHHKTKKAKFFITVPLFLIINIVLLFMIISRLMH